MKKIAAIESNPNFILTKDKFSTPICESYLLENKKAGILRAVFVSNQRYCGDKLNPFYYCYTKQYPECFHVAECYFIDPETMSSGYRHMVYNNNGEMIVNVTDFSAAIGGIAKDYQGNDADLTIFEHFNITPCERGIVIAKDFNSAEKGIQTEYNAIDYSGKSLEDNSRPLEIHENEESSENPDPTKESESSEEGGQPQ